MKRIAFIVLLFLTVSCATKTPAQRKHIPLDLATWHNNQGVRLLAASQFDKAEVEFKTAVEIDPLYPEAQSNLGLIFKYKGEFGPAARQFKKAIKLDPKWAAPYNHLGTVYLSQKRYIKALDYFKRSAGLDKKFADAWYNVGVTHLERAKTTRKRERFLRQAVAAFQKATSIDPRLYNAHMELANTYRELNEIEKAILRYRLSIETNPNESAPWELLAGLYDSQGDAEKAAECRRQARLLGPHGPEEKAEALLMMGDDYRRRGAYREALQAYEEATRARTDFWQAHFGIGLTLEAGGDARRAQEAFRAVLQIHPRHAESLFHLGMLETQTGQTAAGKEHLCRFLEIAKGQDLDEQTSIATQMVAGSGGCR